MKGFTLIEILLYITILSLMITSLFETWYGFDSAFGRYSIRLEKIDAAVLHLQQFYDAKIKK